MTREEFIRKNDKPGVYIGAYADGLSKGLEIAEGFAERVSELRNANAVLRIIDKRPASQLLEIYLTEINEKK